MAHGPKEPTAIGVGDSISTPHKTPEGIALHIHVGAHKTASTHLQKSLRKAHADLLTRGIVFFGPESLRGDFPLPKLSAPNPNPPVALLEQLSRNRSCRLVLSDENILGGTRAGNLAQGAQFYPNADQRMRRLLTSLGSTNVTLYMGIRAPLAFLTSAHGQHIISGRIEPFQSYCEGVALERLRWSELAERLLAITDVKRIVIWRYEDYPRIAPSVLEEMLGHNFEVPVIENALHVSLSVRALEHVKRLLAADPDGPIREMIRESRRLFPKSDQNPGPAYFSSSRIEEDNAAYSEDNMRLLNMERVSFLMAPSQPT